MTSIARRAVFAVRLGLPSVLAVSTAGCATAGGETVFPGAVRLRPPGQNYTSAQLARVVADAFTG